MKMIRRISIVSTFTAPVKSLYIWRKHRHTRHFTLNWCGNTEFLQGKIHQLRLFVGLSLGIDFGWEGARQYVVRVTFLWDCPRNFNGEFQPSGSCGGCFFYKLVSYLDIFFSMVFGCTSCFLVLKGINTSGGFQCIFLFSVDIGILNCGDENKQPQPPHIYAKNTRRSLPFRASWAMWHKMPLSNKSRRPLRGISLPGQRCWNSDRYTPPRIDTKNDGVWNMNLCWLQNRVSTVSMLNFLGG